MTDRVPTIKQKNNVRHPVIDGILNNDQKVIKLIYKQQFDKIRSMVKNFHHLKLDAEDVFQEGLTRAIINVRKGSFKGGSAFSTYLFSICQNICLKEYHKNKKIQDIELKYLVEVPTEDNFDLLQIILTAKNSMDENCRKIIELRFGLNGKEENTRFEKVAEVLGIKPNNARQRFGRCFAKFLELLQQNKEFKLLTR